MDKEIQTRFFIVLIIALIGFYVFSIYADDFSTDDKKRKKTLVNDTKNGALRGCLTGYMTGGVSGAISSAATWGVVSGIMSGIQNCIMGGEDNKSVL